MLNLNKELRDLLRAIDAGRVGLSDGGALVRTVRAGQKVRVERRVRELQEHGFVAEQFIGGRPQLTDAGRAAVTG